MKVSGRGTAAERLKEIEKNKILNKVKKAATAKIKVKEIRDEQGRSKNYTRKS